MSIINSKVKPFNAQAFHQGKFVSVSDKDLIGKWSVVVFYPADFTFVCPTEITRKAFGKPDILIYMETIEEGRFEDTNKMFEVPRDFDMAFISHEWDANEKATEIIKQFNLHDWSAPTTLPISWAFWPACGPWVCPWPCIPKPSC